LCKDVYMSDKSHRVRLNVAKVNVRSFIYTFVLITYTAEND